MANFAILDGDLVINTLVAESKADAESVTSNPCVEYTEENPASVGSTYNATTKVFTSPQPYPSWTLVNNVWTAPVVRPLDTANRWDEATQTWVVITEPTK
jgi:hypothetical protein